MTTPPKSHPLMEFFIGVNNSDIPEVIRSIPRLQYVITETMIASTSKRRGPPPKLRVMRITTKELQGLWKGEHPRFTAYQLLGDRNRIRKLSKRTFESQLCRPKGKRVVVDSRPFTKG